MAELTSYPASIPTMTTLTSISSTTSPTIIAISATPTSLEKTPSSGVKDNHSTAAIIGGAIGGTLALLFLLACIFVPLIRRRRSCLDIALCRRSTNTTNSSATNHNSSIPEKSGQQGDAGGQSDEEQKLEEMVGLEEMLRIEFPTPSRYELDAGSFVEGRANWEIKL